MLTELVVPTLPPPTRLMPIGRTELGIMAWPAEALVRGVVPRTPGATVRPLADVMPRSVDRSPLDPTLSGGKARP